MENEQGTRCPLIVDYAVGTSCWQMGGDHADTRYCLYELRMHCDVGYSLRK
jgi:hypothetical protein